MLYLIWLNNIENFFILKYITCAPFDLILLWESQWNISISQLISSESLVYYCNKHFMYINISFLHLTQFPQKCYLHLYSFILLNYNIKFLFLSVYLKIASVYTCVVTLAPKNPKNSTGGTRNTFAIAFRRKLLQSIRKLVIITLPLKHIVNLNSYCSSN